MRRLLGVAGLVVALVWVGPASAQSALTWGGPTGQIQYRVVSTGGSKVPTAMPASGQSKSSGIASFFAKLNPFAKKSAAAPPALPKQTHISGKTAPGMTGFGQ
jgi:hypothetical protein